MACAARLGRHYGASLSAGADRCGDRCRVPRRKHDFDRVDRADVCHRERSGDDNSNPEASPRALSCPMWYAHRQSRAFWLLSIWPKRHWQRGLTRELVSGQRGKPLAAQSQNSAASCLAVRITSRTLVHGHEQTRTALRLWPHASGRRGWNAPAAPRRDHKRAGAGSWPLPCVSFHPPNTTSCITRPGNSVKIPAPISAKT